MLEKQTALNLKNETPAEKLITKVKVKEKINDWKMHLLSILISWYKDGVRIAARPLAVLTKTMLAGRDWGGFFELHVLTYESCLGDLRKTLEDRGTRAEALAARWVPVDEKSVAVVLLLPHCRGSRRPTQRTYLGRLSQQLSGGLSLKRHSRCAWEMWLNFFRN